MPQLLTTEAIDAFLKSLEVNHATDLTSRFSGEMECQVNVNKSLGEPVYRDGQLVRNVFQCVDDDYGTFEFFPIRVPHNSMGINGDPYYNDRVLTYPLHRVVEDIGMTGWNWKQKRSIWVAFDFDSITSHCEGIGLSDDQLDEVRAKAQSIPWVQVRHSTGGTGLHLYVFFDPDDCPETENHNVHAAASRAVLGMMSREVGFDFRPHVDVCGGNMWVWGRRITEHNLGLGIIHDATEFFPGMPSNWRDNLDVVTGNRARIKVNGIANGDADAFDLHTSAWKKTDLDETHLEIERRIVKAGYSIIWVPDHNCWQTHSKAFADLIEEYPGEYKGVYSTLSDGNDPGTPNCFVFPMPGGALRITRFTRGKREADTWVQDGQSWTWCYFNRNADLFSAASVAGGALDSDGKTWYFTSAEDVSRLFDLLGGNFSLPEAWMEMFGNEERHYMVKTNRQGRLVTEIQKKPKDKAPQGWIDKKGKFVKVFNMQVEDTAVDDINSQTYDHTVRALVGYDGDNAGWVLRDDSGGWVGQRSMSDIRAVLRSMNVDDPEYVMGKLIFEAWRLVNVPFQPEYLGDRKWNRNAAQLVVQPGEPGDHPHWDLVLAHCGKDLDSVIGENAWARQYGVTTGRDYLMMWVASMFKYPYDTLPYLFFYGPQNCGKSSFHESLAMLMSKGYCLADEALRNQSGFNGELAGAILCAVEETNIADAKGAYNRIKQWVTAVDLSIHAKHQQPYMQRNMTHWVQCANEQSYCPIFPGDTRITMMYVGMPEYEIPRDQLRRALMDEAPYFLRSVMDLRLPPPPGRLRLPVIATGAKKEAESYATSALDDFVMEKCHVVDGYETKFSDFYNAFMESIPAASRGMWSKKSVTAHIRDHELAPLGKLGNNLLYVGNVLLYHPGNDYERRKPWMISGEGADAKLVRRP